MKPLCATIAIVVTHLCCIVTADADARQPKGVIGQLNTLIVGPDHFEPHYTTSATPAVTRTRQKVTSAPPPTTDQPSVERKTEFATKTIYGFLDFITTVGDTVMVFTPNSKTQDSKRQSSTVSLGPTVTDLHRLSPSAVSGSPQLTSAAPGDPAPNTPRPVTTEALFATPAALSLESSFENSFDNAFGSVRPATNRWSAVRRRGPQTQRRAPPPSRVQPTPKTAPTLDQGPFQPMAPHPTLVPILIEATATPTVQIPPETRVSLRHNVGYRVKQRPSRRPTTAPFRLDFQSPPTPPPTPEPVETPTPGRLVLSSIDVRPTGLVTTFGGTDVTGILTTVHTTSVIGTYIRGRYAQVLQSSSTIFSSKPVQRTIQPSARQTVHLSATAAEGAASSPPAPLESDILPLEKLFGGLDGDEGAESVFADLVAAGSRPSREVVVAPSRPSRFTLRRRGSPSRLPTSSSSSSRRRQKKEEEKEEETTTLPPRRSYSSGRIRNRSRGPSASERRKQQLLEKRRQKLSEEEPTPTAASLLQRPRQKKAEPLARQSFGSRTSQRPERARGSQRYTSSRDSQPQYSERLSYPQAAGSIVRPQYADRESTTSYEDLRAQYYDTRDQYQDTVSQRYESTRRPQQQDYQNTRQQYQDPRQQYQDSRQQYQDPRQQYQDIRQQYQEPITRRPLQSSRLRVTHPPLTQPTPRPRTRLTRPTRPPTTEPPTPPPTQPTPQYVDELYGPADYYYDYVDYDAVPTTEETVAPTTVSGNSNGDETQILAVSTFRPEGATDFYQEITTLKTLRHISLGRYTNSQWITKTQTRTVEVEPTIAPSPSQVIPPSSTLTPSVLLVATTTTTPRPEIENLLGSPSEAPAVMLPPVHLDPSSPSLPLHTMTETYSTTQLVLKSSVIPLVIADNTRSFTITQTYHVTRVVTALKTMPPVELFDERSALSDAQLEGSHSTNHLDIDGFPEADSLESIGGRFDPDLLEKSTHPEMLALHGSQDKPATEEAKPATQATAEATPVATPSGNPVIAPAPVATPALPALGSSSSPLDQMGQLGQLAQLSQLAQLGQTNQLGGLGQLSPQQLLYLQLLSPYLAQLNPAAAAAQAATGPRTVVSSSPVFVTTTVTNTNRRPVVVTFRATPSTAYITSTTVVSTVLTSYVTSTMTMAPAQPSFFG
ncbi:mucin-2-like [Amphibalanus amphitrite]|uniref:mucin-2-like n=1 Tax=Amphibalanus amphitrite TaxID=1232801 RepID=UPI001C928F21|nr:mucin-2-like [Amphibalanus amphitrite]